MNLYTSDDNFGIAVAISGDIIVIGADKNDATCPGTTPLCNAGAAYVFTRSGTNWTQQAKLTPSDLGVADRFGGAVAIDGATAVVGTGPDDHAGGTDAGSAYVFVQSGTNWNQEAKLIASDASSIDRFGGAVAIPGDNIAVGASTANDGASSSGTTYVFVRTTGWAEQAKLSASDPEANNLFGDAIDIHGNTVVVGAFQEDDAGAASGSAYVFQRTGSNWNQQAKLTPNDTAAGDNFGDGVATIGDAIVVGSPRDDDNGSDSGSAYVFTRNGTWSQQQKLTAGDGQLGDRLCNAMAMDSGLIVAGAFFEDDQGISSGAAYVFAGTTPVSVPGVTSWGLILMGILFLVVLAWRSSVGRQKTVQR